jgi:hypothetical protein
MCITSVLLFIPCFFNVVASYADLLLTSTGPVEQDTLGEYKVDESTVSER